MAPRTTPQQHSTRWGKPEPDLGNARWHSGSQGIGDVQIAFVEGFIAMRNAGRAGSPPLVFTPAQWRTFVVNARHGRFDPR
ncbi:DUF397 domain-containing protein [Streptomyces sp. NBC_00385]|uniref:DUF397 domain-containing protein n=1 Tax=Streptomyces sp. NBC_00385 TaxID=2975733 RepID=UPI002DD94576|nr:DUF397 domain-containing protein [Streptomyces sp. NBC_00385]WRZ08696.1 DUF397 domain-containing protein [Streptomyces sp. NBC_00385]